jgi:hypothetical protein
MTAADIGFDVSPSRKEGTTKSKHADALERFGWRKRREALHSEPKPNSDALVSDRPANYSNFLNAIRIASMPLTNAEIPAAFRKRHLGRHGEKRRTQLFLSAQARAQLEQLSRHKDYTVPAMIDELAANAEARAAETAVRARQNDRHLDQPVPDRVNQICEQ